jgi:type I restriction enzyme M protein
LRGDYKQSEYGKVVLPLTVLRRLDSLLAPTKPKVWELAQKHDDMPENALEAILNNASGYKFHNKSKYDFKELVADPDNLARNFPIISMVSQLLPVKLLNTLTLASKSNV